MVLHEGRSTLLRAKTAKLWAGKALSIGSVLGGCLLLGCPRHAAWDSQQTRSIKSPLVKELPPESSSSLTVSLRALLVTAKSERPLLEQETLHAGDHLYFLLRVSQPAYLYVVLFGPEGDAQVLFPRATEPKARVAPRCPVRIPDQGSFYLQNPAGLQDLRVVASAEPLGVSDRRLCEQLRLPCQTMPKEPLPVCPPERTRALFSALKVATATATGSGGGGAVASLRMQLYQEP